MTALTVVLAVVVGVSLGLMGGGGSILSVPLLTYVAGLDVKEAIASSLLVVAVSSMVGVVTHMRAGRVRWRVALPFGAAAMAGAFCGGLLAGVIPETVLLVTFAVIMIASGIAMLRDRKTTSGDEARQVQVVKVAVLGGVGGALSGLVGAGGGFLLGPALVLLAGLPMPAAVGTSLVVIAMQSLAGVAGHLTGVQIDWSLTAMVTAAVAPIDRVRRLVRRRRVDLRRRVRERARDA